MASRANGKVSGKHAAAGQWCSGVGNTKCCFIESTNLGTRTEVNGRLQQPSSFMDLNIIDTPLEILLTVCYVLVTSNTNIAEMQTIRQKYSVKDHEILFSDTQNLRSMQPSLQL
jgi:hypothetical protein